MAVTLTSEGGDRPERYHVIAVDGDAELSLDCPGPEKSRGLHCTAEGFALDREFDELTLKARGYSFVTRRLTASDFRAASLELALSALPEPESTATYATGFGEDGESAAFDALGVADTTELGAVRSLKFYIEALDEAPRVYFQNTKQFARHVDFVQLGLGRPISAPAFEFATQGPARTAIVGTLIARDGLKVRVRDGELDSPFTLEFFPSDDLTPEQALLAHRLIEERLGFAELAGDTRRLAYVPASARSEAELAAQEAEYRRRDARFAKQSELYAGIGEQVLNPGLSYGTLRRLSPEDLATLVVSRRDILLLTRLPNDLPLVGGTITEELQTPLAHVNLAARARGTPNIAVPGAPNDERIAPWLDKLVRFEVGATSFSLREASLDEARQFWDGEQHEPLAPESDDEFAGLPSFEQLGFADSLRVGAKAANLAELRRLLGELAPHGFAVPFSAFLAYLRENLVTAELCAEADTDCRAEARPEPCASADQLCGAGVEAHDTFETLLTRLLADDAFRADTAVRSACLAMLRVLVEHGEVDPAFGDALDARVAELFGDAAVRLRSSTNVEDLAEFSGAGLYESYSAAASGDHRASLRIRKVWASTWTFAAFEERSLWNVTESAVRMGVAVNQAFGTELANGVLITDNLSAPSSPGYYVNVQAGEVLVANPENGATPEVFSAVPLANGRYETVRQRYSSLSPDTALLSDEEVQLLAQTAQQVEAHFASLYGSTPNRIALDLEFKFLPPDRALVIKQVRPYLARGSPAQLR